MKNLKITTNSETLKFDQAEPNTDPNVMEIHVAENVSQGSKMGQRYSIPHEYIVTIYHRIFGNDQRYPETLGELRSLLSAYGISVNAPAK